MDDESYVKKINSEKPCVLCRPLNDECNMLIEKLDVAMKFISKTRNNYKGSRLEDQCDEVLEKIK